MRAGGGTGLNTHRGAGKSSRAGGTGLATLALFGTDAGVKGGDGGSAASGVTASTPGGCGCRTYGGTAGTGSARWTGGAGFTLEKRGWRGGGVGGISPGSTVGAARCSRGAGRALTFSPLGPAGPGGPMGPVRPYRREKNEDVAPPPAPSGGRSHRVPVPLTRAPSFPGAPSGPFSPTSPCGARRRCREPSPDTLGDTPGDTPGVTPGTCHLPGHPWGRRCQLLLSLRAFPEVLGVPGRRWGRPGRLHPRVEQNWGHRGAHGGTDLWGGHRAPSQRVPSSPTLGPSVPGVPGSPRGPCSPCAPGEPRSPGKPRSPWRGGGTALEKGHGGGRGGGGRGVLGKDVRGQSIHPGGGLGCTGRTGDALR